MQYESVLINHIIDPHPVIVYEEVEVEIIEDEE